MDFDAVQYIVARTEPDHRIRLLAIGTVFLDTVTTIYLLYFSGLPVGEFNPLGALMYQGFVGEVLFMAVPLFNVLLLLYLPGLLGDAVAISNIVVHLFATLINTSHLMRMPLEAAVGISAGNAYVFAITASSGVGVMYYLPQIIERWRGYQESR